ncbi:MAG: endonuclease [Bacteroidetes bacterium]|nr:endonuclease [Bacteroidota bacterium]
MLHKSFCLIFSFVCASFLANAQASEPSAQPTNIQFNNVKAYGFTMKFNPSVATGFLVLKSNQNITDVPVDGTMYEKGQGLATSKVLSVSSADSFGVREVVENTNYYFKVFAYNGTGSNINYLQSNPLSGSVQSLAANAGNYYFTIDTSAGPFVDQLHNLINNHTFISYSPGYRTTILPTIYERDTIGGNAVINCEYSEEVTVYTPPFDFTTVNYSREHVLCKSWMKTYVSYGSGVINYTEGADFFNLLLTEQNSVNAVRSNYSLGIVTNITSQYKGTKFGLDSRGKKVFEPRDDKKGDAARCMMYEMVAYNGLNGSWALNSLLAEAADQQQSVLKLWHQQDPPDKFERTKNEFIYSIQNNRNPFIDHPDWADCISFDNLDKTSYCGFMTGIEAETAEENFQLYPNPNQGIFSMKVNSLRAETVTIEIWNMLGEKCFQTVADVHSGINSLLIHQSNLSKGSYVVRVTPEGKNSFRKMMMVE